MTIELTYEPINQTALDKSEQVVIEQGQEVPQETSMPTIDSASDDVVE